MNKSRCRIARLPHVGFRWQHKVTATVLQQPEQPTSMGPTLSFAQPTPPAAPPITVGTTAGH